MGRELEIAVLDQRGGPDGGSVELAGGWFSEGGLYESEVEQLIKAVVMLILYGFISGSLLYTIVKNLGEGLKGINIQGGSPAGPGASGGGGAEFTVESRLDR